MKFLYRRVYRNIYKAGLSFRRGAKHESLQQAKDYATRDANWLGIETVSENMRDHDTVICFQFVRGHDPSW